MNARSQASVVCLLAQLTAWAVVASGNWPPTGYPLDDAWIHELAARNLVQHGVLGVNPHAYGSGATSPLWALVLAVGALLHVPPPWFSNALNLVLFLLTGQLALRLLSNDGVALPTATLLAVAFGCAPNYVWFALSGMEATFAAFLSVAAVTAWFSPLERQRRLTGIPAALLCLARPEGALVVPLLLVLRRPSSRAEWISLVLVPAATVSGNALVNVILTGQLLPSTFAGRRWLWLAPLQGIGPLGRAQLLVFDWLARLGEFTLGTNVAWLVWISVGVAALGLQTARRGLLALALWTLLWFSVYAVVLPTFGHGGRYQPLVPSLFVLFLCAGALTIGGSLRSLVPADRHFVTMALCVLAVMLISIGPVRALMVWREGHRDAVRHVNDTEVAMGVRLRALPAGARIASFDIGGIGYFSDRPIVEIGGLTDTRVVPYLKDGRMADYLRAEHVDYLVLPLGFTLDRPDPWNFYYRLGLDQAPTLHLESLSRTASNVVVWRRGLRTTLHASPVQQLYSMSFDEVAHESGK
jgi:hypothetical protein